MSGREALTNPELDVEHPARLLDYLRSVSRIGPNETPAIHILAGGVSNRTVLVERAPQHGKSFVIKQALAKLRVDVDWVCNPARIQVEARGLEWLGRILPDGSVPALLFLDADHHLLAMEAIAQPHENWKTRLLAGDLETAHVEQFAELLGTLHRTSRDARGQLEVQFADRTFFEALRLEPYYSYTATRVPPAADFLRRLVGETRARRRAVVHGDYSPKNVLIHRQQLVLLDHEVLHWGDPAFDVGFSLTHLLSKAHFVHTLRSQFAEAARGYWRCYCQTIDDNLWQQELEGPAVRHTLGCLLARVAGRSPLEYLTGLQRRRQEQVVCDLMQRPPRSVEALVSAFETRI